MSAAERRLPPAVTFQSGAQLLIELGIVDHITHQGIRYIATTSPDWPFGEDRPYPYWELAKAAVMETEPFLKFFREHPVVGRGPDKGPRATRKVS